MTDTRVITDFKELTDCIRIIYFN